jgi:hypothetical protein
MTAGRARARKGMGADGRRSGRLREVDCRSSNLSQPINVLMHGGCFALVSYKDCQGADCSRFTGAGLAGDRLE